DDYVEIARAHLNEDAWTAVVGTSWRFIFKDALLEWDSVARESEILERVRRLDPQAGASRTVMELLWGVEFYREALFHSEYGTMINSGAFSGTPGDEAKQKVTQYLEEQGSGKGTVNYRLRDWLISRQRYWGAPIPIVYCPEHGAVAVPDDQLPVELPVDVEWLPTGQSPLKLHPTWKQTTCPVCGGPAERETDTLDTFM